MAAAGQPETTSVEIQDSPPSITEVSIVPNTEVTTRTELVATAEDIDGDAPTPTPPLETVINDIASEITIEGEALAPYFPQLHSPTTNTSVR